MEKEATEESKKESAERGTEKKDIVFEYYAFISYSHADKKVAHALQSWLQQYRLPAALIKGQSSVPKRLSPVFLDKSDLIARGDLNDSLHKNLDVSRYLILLCSKESAKSKYVNDEVRYFIGLGREDQIIPVIINGTPHAKDESEECFPPALLSLSDTKELLGISLPEHGRRDAFLRIVATILQLKLDMLRKRDGAIRRKRRFLIIAAALVICAASFSLIWYNTPHAKYYLDYTYRWEKPVGLFELSNSRRKHMFYSYRLTTLRGEPVKLERVNSAGKLTDPEIANLFTELPKLVFSENGVECYDKYDRMLYRKQYTKNLQAVDFYRPGDDDLPFALSLDSSDALQFYAGSPDSKVGQNRGGAIRYAQDYDENGYMTMRLYKSDNHGGDDGRGTPVQDGNGIYGIRVSRDDLGRVTGYCYVDYEGSDIQSSQGESGRNYYYDENGLLIRAERVNAKGDIIKGPNNDAIQEMKYDEYGNLVEFSTLDEKGEPVLSAKNDAVVFRYVYDENGFMTEQRFFDTEGLPKSVQGDVCSVKCTPDENGRQVKFEFSDKNDEPVLCEAGYAGYDMKLNEEGQLTEIRYFDLDGNTAMSTDIGAHIICQEYLNGLNVRTDYCDENGDPVISAFGYASVCREYDDSNQILKDWCLGTDGKPMLNPYGYCEQRFGYTDGNVSWWAYFDEKGEPCSDSNGVSTYSYTYDNGRVKSLACYGTKGENVLCKDGYYMIYYDYDEKGRLTDAVYYDLNGEIIELK
ncbi:MAG: toll/interleukin-1 receptor domain-containing protein [Lachnospiraceae bacterium]|nr:toll/interleukin-1 receptor domain-containing protein [Lachnospiraceae bacterium]